MRTEIEQLRAQTRHSECILSELASSDSPHLILNRIRSGEKLGSIAETLRRPGSQSGDDSRRNSTTYSRPSDRQAIGTALQLPRSFASTSFTGMGDEEDELSLGPLPAGSAWPVWGMGGHEAGIDQAATLQNDYLMSWDPDALPDANLGPPSPLVGIWNTTSASTPESTKQRARGEGQQIILGQSLGVVEVQSLPPPHSSQTWTTVTDDVGLVDHLMSLYFCWVYPIFASFSKEHFLEDFRAGNERHCSSLLVNAILALGCRFSNQANTRTDPQDSDTAGNHFFAEALRLLQEQGDRHKLTTIQALGLMSIREASCGRSTQSLFLSSQSIKLAIEMGLHVDIEIEAANGEESDPAVRSATFWGAFSLDQ